VTGGDGAGGQEMVPLGFTFNVALVTIVERRAPWSPDFGPEWSTVGVARLRYTATKREWTLQSADSHGRWSRYEYINPVSRVDVLLDEIDRGPTGIFWG
jgi:hypothetical protein